MSKPRAYDLNDPAEHARLFREVAGYLRTCLAQHHGTDLAGRRFAYEAMSVIALAAEEMAEESKGVTP